LLELYEKVEQQRKVLNDAKRVLGDTTMTDLSIVDRIASLQANQVTLQVEKKQMVAQLLEHH